MSTEVKNFTKKQAAVWLAENYRASKKPFSHQAITDYMRNKGLPYYKIGQEVSIPVEALKAWAETNFKRGIHLVGLAIAATYFLQGALEAGESHTLAQVGSIPTSVTNSEWLSPAGKGPGSNTTDPRRLTTEPPVQPANFTTR